MRISEDFVLRQVAKTWVVLPLKRDTVDFDGMIRLNDSGAMLWNCLAQGCDRESLIKTLTDRYNVSPEQAGVDVDEFVQMLKNAGCIE